LKTTVDRCKSPAVGRAAIYCQEMTTRRLDGDIDVSRYVAEAADRLAAISSGIQGLLEDHIPELRGDARVCHWYGAGVLRRDTT
jgi:hypothetical protein